MNHFRQRSVEYVRLCLYLTSVKSFRFSEYHIPIDPIEQVKNWGSGERDIT